MKVKGKNFTAVWLEGTKVKMVDQLKLPFQFKIKESSHWKDTVMAISDMTVRGAGTIGATAAFGMAQAVLLSDKKNLPKNTAMAAKAIKSTRPTAHDLFFAVDSVLEEVKKSRSLKEAKASARKKAFEIFKDYIVCGKKIGEIGNTLIKKNSRILTHCNAGWLALVEWGSATAPIYFAHRQKKKPFVFVDETRPRLQGAKLTAWELSQEGVPHTVISDNAGGHFMKKGEINIVITGADRIALNGDVANKIGTYSAAVLAKENGVPFYVAAPLSTFDRKISSGDGIVIENRSEKEVKTVFGKSKNRLVEVDIFPQKSTALNPAFDVTPAKYIEGIITPRGIIKPAKKYIRRLFG